MKHIRLNIIDRIEFYTPLSDHFSDIKIEPGDTIITTNDDGSLYGICGAIYATQIDTSRQITFEGTR
jgi:hypothetical protein